MSTSTGQPSNPPSMIPPSRHFGQTIRLKPSHKQTYLTHLRTVPSAALKAMSSANIVDFITFLDEDTNVIFVSFKYVGKEEEFMNDMVKMRNDESLKEWWKGTDGCLESYNEGAYSSSEGPMMWKNLTEIFYLKGGESEGPEGEEK